MTKVRNAIESLYKGLATIWEYKEEEDLITGETTTKLVPIHENIPCKVSKRTIASTIGKTDINSTIKYEPVLFINPDIIIEAGSKLSITQNGVTRDYKRSGEPFPYSNHQEVVLQRFDNA